MTKQLDFTLELFNLSNDITIAVEAVGVDVVTLGVEEVTFSNPVKDYNKFTKFLTSLVPGSEKEFKKFLIDTINEITDNVAHSIHSESFKAFIHQEAGTFIHDRYNVPITKVPHGFSVDVSTLIEEATLLTAPGVKAAKDGKTYKTYENVKFEKYIKALLTREILLRLEGCKYRVEL